MPLAQYQQASSSEAEAKQSIQGKNPVSQTRTQGTGQERQKTSIPKPRNELGRPEKENTLPRDFITGRALVEDGGSCLRCIEKGLRCTLNFVGVEGEAKCAACRRSGVQYCIRQYGIEKRIEFEGPPWKNPNYFTVGERPSALEMKEILQEHFLGEETYRHGTYLCETERKQMALPPFNGSDLPMKQRPENWKTTTWRSVLPVWRNRSLHPRPVAPRREYSQSSTKNRDGVSPKSQNTVSDASPYSTTEDTLQYLRLIRKYEPRKAHLNEHINDALGETW
ncbi:hypothetical protein F5Y06DRAFT_262978 [Hypoxylon sp. FL0890]|nr:hypothetical protein F5Y06DRAFT_262978 [Hypoxylon sp. FL0890]